MVSGRRRSLLELYTGLAVVLLLLSPGVSGWVVFAIAAALIVAGLVAFRDLRRTAVAAVLVAALTGVLAVLMQRG